MKKPGLFCGLTILLTALLLVPTRGRAEQSEPDPEEEVNGMEEAGLLEGYEHPTFRGGDLRDFRSWVMSLVGYPRICQENGIQGRVVVSFVVEKSGLIAEVKVLQNPDADLTREVLRVIGLSPGWKPGTILEDGIRGPARVRFTLPVDFRLN